MKKSRKEVLLEKLNARTDPTGKAKPGYSENVAAIKAELAVLEEKAEEELASGDQ